MAYIYIMTQTAELYGILFVIDQPNEARKIFSTAAIVRRFSGWGNRCSS